MARSISSRDYEPAVINWWDFEFEKIEVLCQSSCGTKYTRRLPIGMPHLPPIILDSVFFLYESKKDAEEGKNIGGTGMFVSVTAEDRRAGNFLYAVTNWHVAVRDGCSVIRLNKRDGGCMILNFDPSEWEFKSKWHDLAIISPDIASAKELKISAIAEEMFVSDEELKSGLIGAGEDIFMIGRFIDHDGVSTNVPAARFGHISVMPQLIEQETGAIDKPSYILDLHSRTGFSGSPVFVYRTFGTELLPEGNYTNRTERFVKFLGLHWGSFPEQWELKYEKAAVAHAKSLSTNPEYVKGMSGMSLAVPGSAILEMIHSPKYKQERAAFVVEFQKNNGPDLSPVAEAELR
jgi:hypothetical protein